MKIDNEFNSILGLSESDAIFFLKENGIKHIRVMEKNGKCFMGTSDYRLDRVNLRIKEDKVFSVSRG